MLNQPAQEVLLLARRFLGFCPKGKIRFLLVLPLIQGKAHFKVLAQGTHDPVCVAKSYERPQIPHDHLLDIELEPLFPLIYRQNI